MTFTSDIKSQAALEFLMTYGWALLVIIITISAFIYFGVLNPGRGLPNRCIFSPEIQCVDYKLQVDSLRLLLRNNVAEPIDVSSISLSSDSITPFTCTSSPSNPTSWNPEDIVDLQWSSCSGGGLSSGNKGKIRISIQYNTISSSSAYTREVKGEVYATVE